MTIHTITCGDLAFLGGRWDALAKHDPRHQDANFDTLCHCHGPGPPDSRDVECRDVLRLPVGPNYLLVLCCLCAPRLSEALSGIRDHMLHWFLLKQVEDALRYREERRLAPGPTVADMDWRERVLGVRP